MYNLKVITDETGPIRFEYAEWTDLIEAIDRLQAVVEAGIVSNFTVRMTDNG